MYNSADIIPKLDKLRANPLAYTRLWINIMDRVSGDENIMVDATHPVFFLLEASCVNGAAAMQRAESLTRRLYSSVASNLSDLYRHMSDKDYLSRFANPAITYNTFMLSLDEIKAVADWTRDSNGNPDGTGVKKISIPKHTEVEVAGITFAMQYQIDIRLLPHGGVSVVYVGQPESPLYTLTSNVVEHSVVRVSNFKFLRIVVPMQQFTVSSQVAQLNNAVGFSKTYSFVDQFHYVRAYIKNRADENWTEIRTTHDDLVYDPTKPTVALTVLEGQVKVNVPQYYFNQGMMRDSLRLDIYSTRGPLAINLGNYGPEAFRARWIDRDMDTDNNYTKPLMTFSNLFIFNDSQVTGGTAETSFDELRERVIMRGLVDADEPITKGELVTTLAGRGFDVVTNLDHVTDRQFLATRSISPPSDEATVTGAGCGIQLFQTTLAELVLNGTVLDNGDRITIKPNTLYRSNNGLIQVVQDILRQNMVDMAQTAPGALATMVNEADYFYSPFYYVLDTTNDLFSADAYRLDNPRVIGKTFESDNAPLAIEVSTGSYQILNDMESDEYTLYLRLTVGDTFKQLDVENYYVQLSYVPPGLENRVFVTGEMAMVTDELGNDIYVATFHLDTRYDFDEQHRLLLEPFRTPVNLTTEFDLVYAVKDPDNVGPAALFEDLFDPQSLPDYDPTSGYRGIIHEKISIEFGEWLQGLWTRTRSVASSRIYQTYSEDVYAFYPADVYLTDSTGNLVIGWNETTEEITTTKLHSAGDPIMVDGEHQILHHAGDVVLDSNGNPTYVNGERGILRQIEMMLVDGRYYFATDEAAIAYRTSFVDEIADWVSNDIAELSERMLDRTELYYYPKTTVGKISVIVSGGQEIQVPAAQKWFVEYYMTEEKFENEALKEAIVQKTASVLAESLTANTVTVMDILSNLKDNMKDDILSARVGSDTLGESDTTTKRYQALTVKDKSMRPTVGKQLVALSNLKLTVQDAVTVTFVSHV